ncbi:hypothetical protein AVEN_42816-1 [Araneus ventricosus]|uniref:Uncharacterized protein n=1 Tax=Araneus ventricosus TaxID=182803 RepID=A0A4Y2AG22_ARAVE|nr:hypothetical protein AVEN_42816-1 [Araneus ventricosus]
MCLNLKRGVGDDTQLWHPPPPCQYATPLEIQTRLVMFGHRRVLESAAAAISGGGRQHREAETPCDEFPKKNRADVCLFPIAGDTCRDEGRNILGFERKGVRDTTLPSPEDFPNIYTRCFFKGCG